MEWSYDPEAERLTIEREVRRTGPYGSSCDTYRLTMRPCEVGFNVRRVRNWSSERFTIPGEYRIEETAAAIAEPLALDPVAISDLLLETELWDRRGFIGDARLFPQQIFEKVPVARFVEGGVRGNRWWIVKAIYQDPIFQGGRAVPRERIVRGIEAGLYPERLHSVRGWTLLDYRHLLLAIRHGAWRHRAWGLFVSQLYAAYKPLLDRHDEPWEEFEAFVDAALRFARTERTCALFDEIYNLGGSAEGTRRLRNLDDLRSYRDMLAERTEDRFAQVTIYEYVPPEIELPDGWALADKGTFWKLGELYNCCINVNARYSNLLKGGAGTVAYRPKFAEPDGGGLAFFERANGRWGIAEIRGWSNAAIARAYLRDAERIADRLNEREERLRAEAYERQRARKALVRADARRGRSAR